jgi:DNA repair exonuclease SbcCD ATPase subunit
MSKIQLVKDKLRSRQDLLQKKKTENELLDRQIQESFTKLEKAMARLDVGQEALQFLEDVANSRRNVMKDKIESVMTEAVRLVFGADYRVELSYSVKNNRSSMEIKVVKNTENGEVRRTMKGIGGSVSDSISVPLRLLVLLGSPKTAQVCALDESYKHVDRQRIDLVAEFIQDISHRLGIQIIMCSHHTAMIDKADTVYKIWDDNGKAKYVKEL